MDRHVAPRSRTFVAGTLPRIDGAAAARLCRRLPTAGQVHDHFRTDPSETKPPPEAGHRSRRDRPVPSPDLPLTRLRGAGVDVDPASSRPLGTRRVPGGAGCRRRRPRRRRGRQERPDRQAAPPRRAGGGHRDRMRRASSAAADRTPPATPAKAPISSTDTATSSRSRAVQPLPVGSGHPGRDRPGATPICSRPRPWWPRARIVAGVHRPDHPAGACSFSPWSRSGVMRRRRAGDRPTGEHSGRPRSLTV